MVQYVFVGELLGDAPANGVVSISGKTFRAAAGTKVVRSTRIRSLSFDAGVISASGAGFGHGVGMCQLGARGMAQSGLGVWAILGFYYPGGLLTQLISYQRNHAAKVATRRVLKH